MYGPFWTKETNAHYMVVWLQMAALVIYMVPSGPVVHIETLLCFRQEELGGVLQRKCLPNMGICSTKLHTDFLVENSVLKASQLDCCFSV